MKIENIIKLIQETLKESNVEKFSIEIEGEKVRVTVYKRENKPYTTIGGSGIGTPNIGINPNRIWNKING